MRMGRGCYQIPITWRREGPKERYLRPEASKCTAAKVDVYSGYEAGNPVTYIAVWYDGEGEWYNMRFSGRNLTKALPDFLREIQEDHGYTQAG